MKKILTTIGCFMALGANAGEVSLRDGSGCLIAGKIYQDLYNGCCTYYSTNYTTYNTNVSNCAYTITTLNNDFGTSGCSIYTGSQYINGQHKRIKATPQNCPLDSSIAVVPLAFILAGFSVYRFKKKGKL